MIGFLFGTACLFGLTRMIGHHHHGYGRDFCGGGFRDRFHGHHGRHGHHGHHGRGGFGPRAFLRGIFERLDTTPAQEKVILDAVAKARESMRAARTELKGARGDVAAALRGESFDEVSLGGATAKLESAIDQLRKALIDAFAEIHGALDSHQRSRLADFIETGRSPGARWNDEPFGPFSPFYPVDRCS